MNWKQFYKERPISLERYIEDIWEHTALLTEIAHVAHKNRTILEVGSGKGFHSIFLSYLGYKVVSIDNNEGVLDIAKHSSNYLNGKVTFRKANAFNLPFDDNSFGICFSQGFFEHFNDDDIRKLIKEQLRVSEVVIFSVPSFWYPKQDFGDERLMKKDEWLKILDKCKVLKAVYYIGKKGTESKPSQIYFVVEETD